MLCTTISPVRDSLLIPQLYILHTTYYILHTTYYILHTTYYILHTTYYILHTTYYILHTTYYILHTTYYILHTTYYILHTTYYILPPTSYLPVQTFFNRQGSSVQNHPPPRSNKRSSISTSISILHSTSSLFACAIRHPRKHGRPMFWPCAGHCAGGHLRDHA